MMKFIDSNIIVDLTLQSSDLKCNMLSIINSKLREQYEKKAFEFGIVKKINKINTILKEQITNINANLYIVLEINVKIYVPQIYDKIEMKIKKILPYGIYLEIDPFVKCLISTEDVQNFTIDDKINVILSDIRFDSDSFHCIGKFD